MSRRRGLLAAGAVALIALVAWLGNEAGNATARAELEPACACAHESVESTLEQSGELFYRFFGGDAGEVRSFMRDEVDGLCGDLRARVAFGQWNLGRSWSPRPDAGRAARVRAILERARPRCPEIYRELFSGLGATDTDVDGLCDELFASMEPAEAASEPVSAWVWPSLIDGSMCLDAVRSPRVIDTNRP